VEARLRFVSFQILDLVDSEKRYHLQLDPAFPLGLNLFEYPADATAEPMSWHERLEIFCPLAGSGTFRMGEREEVFAAGDILLIDNLQLHCVGRFEGPLRRALVVVFYPELVAPPGALPCDLWLLRPFRNLQDGCLHLRSRDRMAAEAWDCLNRLVLAWVERHGDAEGQARQKAILAELLICLGKAFEDRLMENRDHELRRDSLRRLAPLFARVASQNQEPLDIPAAARMVKMSPSYFMRFFRKATGLTFSVYVDQMRASRAHQLLVESDLSLAQIAAATGFCDQCHMNRQIRRRFGTTPGRIRSIARAVGTNSMELRPG
jgi:AraC-like DNA-binding protein